MYFVGIFFILASVFSLQLFSGTEYEAESISFVVDKESVVAPRGIILDREGRILADNKVAFDIYLKYSGDIEGDYNFVKEKLANFFGDEHIVNLKEIDTTVNYNQLILANLDNAAVDTLTSDTEVSNKLLITKKYIRDYKYPSEFTHILGYVGEPDSGDENDTLAGKYRIESIYDGILQGEQGSEISSGMSEIYVPPTIGGSVHLTIDASWQNYLYKLFADYTDRYGAAGGAGVIMNAETGEIRAMVSYPGFDINKISIGMSVDEFNSLQNSRLNPLLDKAISGAYTPGSIFKIITSYALLDNEIIDPNTTYFSNSCINMGGGFNFCEYGQNFYGQMNIVRALEKSSNLFFCNYALQMKKDDDINLFIDTAEKFGIGTATGINLESENSGNMDSPEYKLEQFNEGWFDGDVCNAVIGQGAVTVTPIQMATVVAAIENGGKKVIPKIVEFTEENGFRSYTKSESTEIYNFNKDIIETIFEGMNGVAYSSESAVSGFLKDLPNSIKAKTGSAETFENINGQFIPRVHSWIVGSFEFENETYTFSFFHQYGGGGYYIAPLLRDFLTYIN